MSEKRKDHRGRVLRKGESQRKDLLYQYRYMDLGGKRRTVYSSDLRKLREKESEIQKFLNSGADYAGGNITVVELVERYICLKKGVRYNTWVGYQFVLNLIRKEDFGYRRIRDVKVFDAKQWFMKLAEDGRGYSTIANVRGVVKPAFQMAYNEEIVRRNPFDFRLDMIPNNSKRRVAMTEEEQKKFLTFIEEDGHYCRYLDEFLVLLGTGMRISEFTGLTMRDIDFEKQRIRVDHQLVRTRDGDYYIEEAKTKSGVRYIPMTENVYRSLKNIVANRSAVENEKVVSGRSGFILLDREGNPKVAAHIEHVMKRAWNKYNATHEMPLPPVTPHVLRHTFCTNMANAGMDIKSLQYLMGHSDVSVTLNVYTHANYEKAEQEMRQIEHSS
ncbi:MAG: site-specific integrase [Roseburia sp.]|nr:site-specific integrase [Roseburia sp.]